MDAEQVVLTYGDMIYRIAMGYMKNKEDAEDIYSEVFLILFKKEREFESEEHRKAWLIRVTINCCKQVLMKRPILEELNDEIVAPPAKGVSDEEKMDLYKAIANLKDEYRTVIELYYLQDCSVKQISEIMEKPENTVKSHLMRAREKLKEYLS
ncbi:MAG: sigma-70 family RNA polymerase sigma factor [Lachnospiraceae bacterium]|nr:sigma-70 family RNA polymerase sigma factor [Lachnospiraceae bacterium]